MLTVIKIQNDKTDVVSLHDGVPCDNKMAHPAIVPSSTTTTTTVTNKDKSTATTINQGHCGIAAKTAIVNAPEAGGPLSTTAEDHCQRQPRTIVHGHRQRTIDKQEGRCEKGHRFPSYLSGTEFMTSEE
jgi:hypothetical protein